MVGMKCSVETAPSSPTYVTMVKCVSDHTSHSLPSLHLATSPPGMASWKQVMRPFWLLPPKPARKYPLTDTSPTFGRAGAGGATGGAAGAGGADVAAGVTGSAGGCSSARAGVDSKAAANAAATAADRPSHRRARRIAVMAR